MLSVALLGAVAVLVGVGWVLLRQARRGAASGAAFLATAATARADVVAIREKYPRGPRGDDMPSYFPVVTFALPDGRVVESEVMVGARPAPARVGATVEVRYDPDDPRRVALAHRMATVGSLGCFATGLGVTFLAFGVAVLLVWVLLRLVLQVPG